jgi:hypothetical protein
MSGAAAAGHGRKPVRWAGPEPLTFQKSGVIVVIAPDLLAVRRRRQPQEVLGIELQVGGDSVALSPEISRLRDVCRRISVQL